ncbi:divergent PAP2 family protein [Spirochaetia bacterium 38H-sp]|uniref:Divergent PAP2 family protein n=1 Tax=Rarispira pelagica TaxID=3141764 RepID=A0ABU9UAD4_9SPIR
MMKEKISALFVSPVFLSAFFSWFGAQLLKVIIDTLKRRARKKEDVVSTLLWKTGGMPSSHSSLVTALTTSIGFVEGITSPLFIMSFFYAAIIIRDAMGVRKAAGLQAQKINEMGEYLKKNHNMDFSPVKVVHGHKVEEVIVGMVLGFFIALAFCLL